MLFRLSLRAGFPAWSEALPVDTAMRRIFLGSAALLLMTATPAGAQMNRCNLNGKTVIQEAPCPGVRRADSMPPAERPVLAASEDAAQGTGPIVAGKKLCRAGVAKFGTWQDPDSLKIGEVLGGQMTVIDFASRKIGARQFFVGVNAKNEYGAYTGEKSLTCYTSEDGLRILKVDGM